MMMMMMMIDHHDDDDDDDEAERSKRKESKHITLWPQQRMRSKRSEGPNGLVQLHM